MADAFGFDLSKYAPAKPKAPTEPRHIVKVYSYRDETGTILHETVRFEPKDFEQQHPDPNGGLPIRNLNGVRRVLYLMPELIAADPTLSVYIPEGEKDCDNLTALGWIATTNALGAKAKWRADYTPFLAGRHVVIIPDNDDTGREHSIQVAKAVASVAASVKIVNLPGLPDKGDVSDYLTAGHTAEELLTIVGATPLWQPEAPKLIGNDTPRETDLGNAIRLVARHGKDLRYCAVLGGWFAWDGKRWLLDDSGEVERRAKDTVKAIFAEASAAKNDGESRELGEWALTSQSAGRIAAMILLAKSELGIPARPVDFDADPWLLNCENGLLDLKTGTLRPHERDALMTKLSPVNYDPTAKLDTWDNFLADSTGRDADLIAFLQRAVGYTLTGRTDEEKLFFVSGPAATGKSTFLEAIKSTLGDYAKTADFEAFLQRRDTGGPRPDIARLAGARAVLSIEVDEGKTLAEGLVKMLTGGDTVTARELYARAFEFVPAFKLWLAANHEPKVDDADSAMWRRILRVPFDRIVPKAERDPQVKATLRDPKIGGPSILAWAVAGCLAWQQDGLGVPPVVEKATEAYRLDQDPLKDFLADCCEVKADAWTPAAALRRAYEDWAKESGDRDLLSGKAWAAKLREHGFTAKAKLIDRKTTKVWIGLRLLDAPEQPNLDGTDDNDLSAEVPYEDITSSGVLPHITPESVNLAQFSNRGEFTESEVISGNIADEVIIPSVDTAIAPPEPDDHSVEILTLARARGWRSIVVDGRFVAGGTMSEWRDFLAMHAAADLEATLAALQAEVSE